MASATVTVQPSAELRAAIDEVNETLEAIQESQVPFDYDTIKPLAMDAAKLVAEYYDALVQGKLPSELTANLVYDFHRVLWGQPTNDDQE